MLLVTSVKSYIETQPSGRNYAVCCWRENLLAGMFTPFLTRELRACARASYSSLARLVDSCKLFLDFRLLSAFDNFWRAINRRNGDLCC